LNRPTTEIELKISGIKVTLYTYYLRGDRKAIEAIMLENAKFEQVDGESKLKRVDATYRVRMNDKAVLLAVKKLVDKDGKELEVKTETFDKMPDDDFNQIQDALPKPRKKKSTTKQ